MTQAVPISKQIVLLMEWLRGLNGTSGADGPEYAKVIAWVKELPPGSRPTELLGLLQSTFKVTEDQLASSLQTERRSRKREFDDFIPTGTWFADYLQYTRETEPPTVFHFFAGAVAIGSVLARNVYFDKGAYQVYPNLAVLVIAPSGRCRKTSACNLGMGLLRKAGGNVLADKATPEALVDAFKERDSAVGTIYAPEFSVFLGKQKYQEGMIPMLTALFDCPKEWKSQTITRGEVTLRNVAFSLLGCSTMDWIQTAIPRDAFGGGFMSRLLFVVQETTPRSFPLPPPLNIELQTRLVNRLRDMTHLRGEARMTEEAEEWYVTWYNSKKDDKQDDKQFAGYHERKPDHIIRLALILMAARSNDLTLQKGDLIRALHILEWLEAFLPDAFGEMNQTQIGEDHARLIKQIKKRGGKITHSDWLRLNSNRINQRQFRDLVETLINARVLEFDTAIHTYYLTPQGWE